MSGSASLGVEQAMLSHTLGIGPVAAVSRAYVALCLATLVPDEQVRGVEVSGNGYARMAASFQVLASPPNMAANTTTVAFPIAAAPWGVLGYFELWDAPYGGNRLYWGALVDPADGTTPITLSVSAGDVLRFSAGALGVRIGPSGAGTTGGAFLPLVGGTLASPGNLTVGGTFNVTGAAAALGGPLSVTGPTVLAGGATITGESSIRLGNFSLAFDPTLPLHAATKQYVDGGGAGGGLGPFLPTTGGSLNGPGNLTVGGTSTLTGAATASSSFNSLGTATFGTGGAFKQIQIIGGAAQSFINGLGGAMTMQSAPGFNLNFNPLPASVGSPGTAVALNGQLIHNLYANGTPPITGLSFDGARFVASSDSIVVAPGQAVNWVDIIGNLGALQWQASTAVTINLTRNNGGRVYICRTAGTTAASGGPTGTGTGITDGTAVWDYQSSDFVGIHQALNVTMNVRSTTGPTATNQQRQWPAFISTFTGYGNQGGTAPSSGYALGIGYAGALQSWLMATGTNWQSIGGMEVDVGIATGATAKTRYGLNIVSYGNLQAAQEDCAIGFGTSNAGGAPPWNNILMLGEGAVMASGTHSIISYKPRPPGALAGGTYLNPGAALGVDLANIAFSTAAIRTPGGGGIDGRGYFFSGAARLSTSGGIVALDAIGSIVTAIASLDVTTPPLGFKAGDQVYALDGSGSIVTINTVDGTGLPLTWTLTVAGGVLAAPPANPVTFYGGSGAVSARFNLTWTRADGLSLNPTGQKIGAFGATPIVKPTGVAVTAAGIHAALTSLGWIAP